MWHTGEQKKISYRFLVGKPEGKMSNAKCRWDLILNDT